MQSFRLLPSLIVWLAPLALSACVLSHGNQEGAPSPAKTAAQALVNGLGVFSGVGVTSGTTPATAAEDLKAAADDAPPREKAEIKTLLPILTRLQSGAQSLTTEDYQKVAGLMRQVAAEHPDDFELQLAMNRGIDSMELAAQSTAGSDTAGLARAEALTRRFPGEARAHAYLGQVLSATGGDQLTALRSFSRCLELDPASMSCKTSFRTLADDYRRPRCTAFHRDRFGLHPAYEPAHAKGHGKTRPIEVHGQKLVMETEPALTGTDINEVFPTAGGELDVYLTPTAAARLGAVTAKLAASDGYLAIVVNGKTVTAPRVMSAIDTGEVRLSGAGIDLPKLCQKFVKRALPEDLARVYASGSGR